MRVHSNEKIQQIKAFRARGYSINEIVEKLKVPKTTVWHHIKDVVVFPEYRKQLQSKRGGSALRSAKEWVEAKKQAKILLSGEQRDLVLAATMLYWGEGSKKVCDITNTDPKLLQLYLKFLYEAAGVTQDSIKFAVRIFTGMNREECLRYWSEALKVGVNKFIIRYNDGGTKGKARYGTCRISLRKGRKILKLMHSLIRFGFSELMGFHTLIPQWINYKRE